MLALLSKSVLVSELGLSLASFEMIQPRRIKCPHYNFSPTEQELPIIAAFLPRSLIFSAVCVTSHHFSTKKCVIA